MVNAAERAVNQAENASNDVELTTAICLFHHVARAEAAVDKLRALGIPAAEIAVIGDAHTYISGNVDSPTLRSLRVPDADVELLMEGLTGGGTLVAVRTPPELTNSVEQIFEGESAELLDEHIIETNSEEIPSTRTTYPVVVLDSATSALEPIDPIDPLNRVD